MRLRWVFLLCMMLLPSGLIAQSDEAAIKKEIRAGYDKHVLAFKAKDVKTLVALTTPDWKVTDANGASANRAQWETTLIAQMPRIKKIREYSVSLDKVTFINGKVTAFTTTHFVGTNSDPTGKTHDVVEKAKARDNWVKTSAGWRIQHSDALSFEVIVDGKPINPYAGTKPTKPASGPSK